jgi:hypothetical protein
MYSTLNNFTGGKKNRFFFNCIGVTRVPTVKGMTNLPFEGTEAFFDKEKLA